MDRASLFFKGPEDPPTFAMDETMPDFPLPDLDSTLDRYYQSLIPFGTEEELAKSREIIKRFREGVGPILHQQIVDRTKVTKNWVSCVSDGSMSEPSITNGLVTYVEREWISPFIEFYLSFGLHYKTF